MDVLVIGNGGREHALAWKLAQSPRATRVWVAPGNGGTGRGAADKGQEVGNRFADVENIEPCFCDLRRPFSSLIEFARRAAVDLTIVGPEAPLADGIVDAFTAVGLRCFGPTQAAARLETSKAFARAFMARHGIPGPGHAVFTDHEAALAYLHSLTCDVVIKASGLAAGKGVIVPNDQTEAEAALRQIMVERAFGPAGDEVVIEERLYGQEVSVLAFSDGQAVALMPAAQDHKRVFDGDQGPNTGGMGAYAPTPLVTPNLLTEIVQGVLQPTLDGMRAECMPYIGVLYAGLMITGAGPRVLEYNCRFGDPETQVILPLLETDLVDLIEACLDQTLAGQDVRWRPGVAATVVAASQGYPGSYPKGLAIAGISEAEALPGVAVFHAGTRYAADGSLVTDGGRVLAVTGVASDLSQALERAYAGMGRIHFEGMHYRRDIGAKALP